MILDRNKLQDETIMLGTAEVARRLGVKRREMINYLIKENKFPNVLKENNKYSIPVSDVRWYEELCNEHDTNECLDTSRAAERLRYKAPFLINQLIEKSILPNAFQKNNKWYIPLADIEAIEKMSDENLDVKRAAETLGVTSAKVTDMIRNNVFPSSFNDVFGVSRVLYKDMEEYKVRKELAQKYNGKSFSTAEAAKILGYKITSTCFKDLEVFTRVD